MPAEGAHESFPMLTEGSHTALGILEPDDPNTARLVWLKIEGLSDDPDKAKIDFSVAMGPADAARIGAGLLNAAKQAIDLDRDEARRAAAIVLPERRH